MGAITSTSSRLDAALEYLERGWHIIPIRPDTKRPAIKWTEYQTRQPTPEEVEGWLEQWPDAEIAIVTGEKSGVVVVDCDNEEALAYATSYGLNSPVRVKTKRGHHLYFRHPRDGKRRGPRAGVNSRGTDWPRINGLDFRGDGSYALLPPSKGYKWSVAPGHDMFDDMPAWTDWSPTANQYEEFKSDGFSFDKLDLSSVRVGMADDFISEWDRTAKYAKDRFPSGKIPTGQGNGRNERVLRYASECVLDGYFGAELRLRVAAFMREFFLDPLPDREFEATCGSVEQMERRNHPERFDESGNYIHKTRKERVEALVHEDRRLIYVRDADKLIEKSRSAEYLIEPWLKRGTIVQVYGFSGHGKSLFVQNALYALACGARYFGPFEITQVARTLYIDFEMGPGTIGVRLAQMREIFGDAGDRFGIWTPFLTEKEMNLNQASGLAELEAWVRWYAPDVVVLDTIRSAWPGLEENSAEAWAKVNRLAVNLRNAGVSVILVHHSNKPNDLGPGSSAGSTNQLTVLETQIRISKVLPNEEDAKNTYAVFDGSYERPVWPELRSKMPETGILQSVLEVRYGKVRDWTDLHETVQWVGFGVDSEKDERYMVGSSSPKRKAKELALEGLTPAGIANALHRPVRVVRQWLGLTEP